MKRKPRLQFSDADLAEPKLEKPIKRVKKAEAKADKAQAKIPKKTVVKKERGFDPATGKVKTQLRFEEVDKKKPPSKLTHAVQDAPANFVLQPPAALHGLLYLVRGLYAYIVILALPHLSVNLRENKVGRGILHGMGQL